MLTRRIHAMSQPTRAAWIEISVSLLKMAVLVSQPTRAAWIEITFDLTITFRNSVSQPSWAAWIEIGNSAAGSNAPLVAALLGCVD